MRDCERYLNDPNVTSDVINDFDSKLNLKTEFGKKSEMGFSFHHLLTLIMYSVLYRDQHEKVRD